jgi:hypothetical protein
VVPIQEIGRFPFRKFGRVLQICKRSIGSEKNVYFLVNHHQKSHTAKLFISGCTSMTSSELDDFPEGIIKAPEIAV